MRLGAVADVEEARGRRCARRGVRAGRPRRRARRSSAGSEQRAVVGDAARARAAAASSTRPSRGEQPVDDAVPGQLLGERLPAPPQSRRLLAVLVEPARARSPSACGSARRRRRSRPSRHRLERAARVVRGDDRLLGQERLVRHQPEVLVDRRVVDGEAASRRGRRARRSSTRPPKRTRPSRPSAGGELLEARGGRGRRRRRRRAARPAAAGLEQQVDALGGVEPAHRERRSRRTRRSGTAAAAAAAAAPLRRDPSTRAGASATLARWRSRRAGLAERAPVEAVHGAAASRGPAARDRTGRAACRPARTPGGTGARARRPCSGGAPRTTGTSSPITRSIGSPFASVRSSRRQSSGSVSTRSFGYHLNGTRHELGAVAAPLEARGELAREDLGAARLERHLRQADGDPHRAADDRVVLRPEDDLVQPLDVRVLRGLRLGESLAGRQAHGPQALGVRRLVEVPGLLDGEPRLPDEEGQGLGHERLGVGEVGEVVLERDERDRVRRLQDEQAAGPERGQPPARGSARARAGAGARRRGRRRSRRASPARRASRYASASPCSTSRPSPRQKAAMSASASTPRASMPASRSRLRNSPRPQPDVEHRGGVPEVADVGRLPAADLLAVLAHAALEGEVVERRFRRRRRGRQRARRLHGAAGRRSTRSSRSSSLRASASRAATASCSRATWTASSSRRSCNACVPAAVHAVMSSASRSTAPLNALWSAAIGSTYQRVSLRTHGLRRRSLRRRGCGPSAQAAGRTGGRR